MNKQATHFDDVPSAFLFLFTIATGDSWYDYVWDLCDAVNSKYLAPLYFVLFIFTCSFFQLELFVGVVVDSFARLKDLFEGTLDDNTGLSLIYVDKQQTHITRTQVRFYSQRNREVGQTRVD